ncbi:unnamed protein product, partial [marine sediment metagenome]
QGNHLLQNLCGLLIGSCVFGGERAAVIREKALLHLSRVAEEQILADGMHEERSFSYHIKALLDLLEVVTLAQCGAFRSMGSKGQEAAQRLGRLVARMAGAVASTWEQVSDLPLMNDSEEVPQQIAELAIARASSVVGLSLPSTGDRCNGSGYLVGSVGPWSAVLDVGPAGPDHQMGHAHADHLGFEVWYRRRKLVCDSGNVTYNEGHKRQWYRSTAAHNTVRIEGQDSL